MKIGIPRALLYYYYYPFWKSLFQELGFEVVVSDQTSELLLNKGIKNSISEICVPMKVYMGHVLNLLDKEVNYIYIPRFISIKKGITFCPKFLGLPDMVKNSLPGIEDKILTNHIESKSDNISNYKNYRCFINKLNIKKRKLKSALNRAKKNWKNFRELNKRGHTIDSLIEEESDNRFSENKLSLENNEVNLDDERLTIGVIGYVYNVYDKYISMYLIEKLKKMNIEIRTFSMLDNSIIEHQLERFDKLMFWQFSNKLLGAGYHFIESPDIDGILHVTAFGCGPDSMVGTFLDIDANEANKPFMTLRIDEQTGESHLITRIEAFVDLIRLKNNKQNEGVS